MDWAYVAVRPGGVRWALVLLGLLSLLLELLNSLSVLQVVSELQGNVRESACVSDWITRDTYGSLILAVDSVVGTLLAVLELGVTGRVVVGLGSTGLSEVDVSFGGKRADEVLTVGSMAPSLLDIL